MSSPASLIVHAARVLGHPGATAVAVRGDRIQAVGTPETADFVRDSRTRVISVPDGLVCPGFHDAHAHLVPTAIARMEVDLHGCDPDRIRDRLRQRARETAPGRWIVGRGYDPDVLAQLGSRIRTMLDDLCPAHPVLLRAHDYHSVALNSAGLARIGYESAPDDETRALVPVDADGRPVGLLLEELANVAGSRAGDRTLEEQIEGTLAVVRDLHATGVTALHEMSGSYHGDVLAAVDATGELALDVFATHGPAELDGTRRRDGSSVRFRGVKLFLDGAIGSRSAHLLEPYAGRCERHGAAHRGMELLDRDQLHRAVLRANALGLPCFLHAIGDAAVRSGLDALSAAPGRRHRLEHAEIVHPDDEPRFAELGVTASVQPIHLLEDAALVRERLPDRTDRILPLRRLLDRGARVVLGSDAPVEDFDIVAGLRAAIERRGNDGRPLHPEQGLTPAEALQSYTSDAAWAVGAEDEQGRLEPGLLASLAVLSHDVVRHPSALADTRVVATVHRGSVVHEVES